MKHNQQHARSGRKSRGSISLLERIQPDAAGIDCGQNSHFVAVPTDRDPQPVREFRTFTAELHRLADWLAQCEAKTVALESTGSIGSRSMRSPSTGLRSAAGQRPGRT